MCVEGSGRTVRALENQLHLAEHLAELFCLLQQISMQEDEIDTLTASTFAAPAGPSSLVTWSLACRGRSMAFVRVLARPKKNEAIVNRSSQKGGSRSASDFAHQKE